MRLAISLALIAATTTACTVSTGDDAPPPVAGGVGEDPQDPGSDDTGEAPVEETGNPIVPSGDDADSDGFGIAEDCNDNDASVYPGAPEIACDNIDQDCNGLVDDGVDAWWKEVEQTDFGADGEIDQVRTTSFDENDFPERIELDSDMDGAADQITFKTWDQGLHVEDYVTPSGLRLTFTYDDDRRLILEQSEIFVDGFGLFETVAETVYDDDGNIVIEREDNQNDGVWDIVTEKEWSDGNLVRETLENDGDDEPDFIEETTYDDDGKVIERRTDYSGNGLDVQIETFTYSVDGHLTGREVTRPDGGEVLRVVTVITDDQGRTTQQTTDHGGDGNIDQIETYTWSGTELASYGLDLGGDSTFEFFEEWTFDAFGNLESYRSGTAPGQWNLEETTTWSCR